MELADTSRPSDARMRHFHALDRTAQTDAIRGLAVAGWSEQSIARATQLSVEMIGYVLLEHQSSEI